MDKKSLLHFLEEEPLSGEGECDNIVLSWDTRVSLSSASFLLAGQRKNDDHNSDNYYNEVDQCLHRNTSSFSPSRVLNALCILIYTPSLYI